MTVALLDRTVCQLAKDEFEAALRHTFGINGYVPGTTQSANALALSMKHTHAAYEMLSAIGKPVELCVENGLNADLLTTIAREYTPSSKSRHASKTVLPDNHAGLQSDIFQTLSRIATVIEASE